MCYIRTGKCGKNPTAEQRSVAEGSTGGRFAGRKAEESHANVADKPKVEMDKTPLVRWATISLSSSGALSNDGALLCF